ncbi:MAG TPA: thioredoxin domain-containing protein [Polyangiaceae bacterium]|nr:thioredoxin domain-containing protein [Polyangiaceae bacterium]
MAVLAAACGGAQQDSSQVALPKLPPGHPADGPQIAMAPAEKSEADTAVPITANDPTWGSRDAPVTLVEFTDLQCPFCSRAEATVEQLEQAYGREQLRVVYKANPLPFHPNAKPAALAAATVHGLGGNEAFWTFYKLAFDHQADLGDAMYEQWAKQSGVSVPAFRDALAARRFAAPVDEGAELAKKLGANGTPSFFINGVSVVGAQPIDKFKQVIDAQLAAAKEKLAAGTPRAEVYRVLVAANYKPQADEDEDEPKPDTAVWKVPATGPALGPKTALVTIVEFADFQCPFCKRVEPTLQQVRTTYGNDVRIVFKHEPLPFHPRAEPAAQLALEALAEKGDAGFWAAHDKLFDAQPKLEDADLEQVARDLQLDVSKVQAAIKTHKYKRALDEDADLADDFQANGTPHFFINGRRLVGAQPFDKFKQLIDEQLVKARALVSTGIKPENVYGELLKTAQAAPAPEQKTITLAGAAPVRGPASAPVTIVEFADFQCPYCKKADETLAQVLKDYPTKVRLVWRHLPLQFHAQAHLAAEAGTEAFKERGNDGFWKLHDAMFAHQGDQDGLSRGAIDGYAKAAGVDAKKFAHALDTGANAASVDADAKSGTDAGINGTPAFLIGTGTPSGSWTAYYLSGAQPIAKFRKLIELALKPAAHKP